MSTAAAPVTLHDAINYFTDLNRCTEILALAWRRSILPVFGRGHAYRYNSRNTNDAHRLMGVLNAVTGKRVTYEKLTGKNETEVV